LERLFQIDLVSRQELIDEFFRYMDERPDQETFVLKHGSGSFEAEEIDHDCDCGEEHA
jgi:hypothetical protein